jgi:hypothetical protein
MTDQLSGNAILRMLLVTLAQVWLGVIGMTMSLSGTMPSCGGRVICAIVGMAASGSLFVRIVVAQLERFYRGGLGSELSSPSA